VDGLAEPVQFVGHSSFIITEVMKMYAYAGVFKGYDTVHHINSAAVISRPRHI
jgi:hypothetical protein